VDDIRNAKNEYTSDDAYDTGRFRAAGSRVQTRFGTRDHLIRQGQCSSKPAKDKTKLSTSQDDVALEAVGVTGASGQVAGAWPPGTLLARQKFDQRKARRRYQLEFFGVKIARTNGEFI